MNQRDQLTDELLSAFLDGELAGDELSLVERLLEEDPSHQQALDELQSLGVEMQSLPRYELGDDFCRRVLDASRQKQPPVPADTAPAHTGKHRDVVAPVAQLQRDGETRMFRGGRPLIYALLALAAAVMVMLASPAQKDIDDPAGQPGVAVPGVKTNGATDDPGSFVSNSQTPADVDAPTTTSPLAPKSHGPKSYGPKRAGSDLAQATPNSIGDAASPSSVATDSPKTARRESPDGTGSEAQAGSALAGSDPKAAGLDDPDSGSARRPKPMQVADARPTPDIVGVPNVPDAAVAAEGLIQYLFVINVEPTAEGTKKHVFLNALKGHGIRFETDLKVDDGLERAMLASQMLAPVKAGQERVKADLFYVVATGSQIDSSVQHLGASGLVNRMHFDVAMRSVQIDVFRKLRIADARDRKIKAEVVAQGGRARRLLLNLAALSPAVRQLGGQALLTSDPGDVKSLLPPAIGDEQAPLGANDLFEVLFVVRRR